MRNDSIAKVVAEMRADLVGGRYPDTGEPHATVLYRLWHGEGPGLEGHMSLATVAHIEEYAARIEALLAK